ncbi:MAG: hypothetical protein R3B48_23980 [Kofleriaceae bacterium]
MVTEPPRDVARVTGERARWRGSRSWSQAFHAQATAKLVARLLRYAASQARSSGAGARELVREALDATVTGARPWNPRATSLQAHLVGVIRARSELEREPRQRDRRASAGPAATSGGTPADPTTAKILAVLREAFTEPEFEALQQDAWLHEDAIDAMYGAAGSSEEAAAVRALMLWVREQLALGG